MALEVIAALGPEYRVVGLAAGSSVERLAQQAAETGARYLAVADEEAARALAEALPKR
ncbi:MAG: 1-deoxy-D-xylulose-5-phosphate reductoisomerase, partial [Phycisphaerae bacterium]